MSIGPTREKLIFERGYRAGAQASLLDARVVINRWVHVTAACAQVLYENAAHRYEQAGYTYDVGGFYARAAVARQIAEVTLAEYEKAMKAKELKHG